MRPPVKKEQSEGETQAGTDGPLQLAAVAMGIAALIGTAFLFGYAVYYWKTKSTYCYFEPLIWQSALPRHVISNALFESLCFLYKDIDDSLKPMVGAAGLVSGGLICLFITKRMFGRLGSYSASEKQEFVEAEQLESDRKD
jgi:hypothetical protein